MNRIFPALALILGLSFFSACDQNRVFEDFQGMPAIRWTVEDTVTFETDWEAEGHTAFVAVRYNTDYDYHNLYVRYFLEDTVSQAVEEKLVNLQLFDSKTGKPLGDGFGSTYTLYDTLPIEQNGQKISFVQYMRQKELKGIEAVGFKITRN
ncbi:gliding motility lipoprotein GldH [Litoribacter ruber]|uniref:Gliding motility lipoprotein GldH n=1 Tax=Litoribacter ruber TaxID=702568 RepID=A0AAP2CFL7_9BACT|nr:MULTISPECIES: gliding motility lipoprotein GldH [Litoribacter]MBS9522820.1 gliding motility lipoprotein GldH [Litoribacter alkaliphilus]MBT0812327.1 gliding motility lipoprotein GldH [Litoribacter ruber]